MVITLLLKMMTYKKPQCKETQTRERIQIMKFQNTPNQFVKDCEKALAEERAALFKAAKEGDVEYVGHKVKRYKMLLKKTSDNLTNLAIALRLNGTKDAGLFDSIGYLLKHISNERKTIGAEVMSASFVRSVYGFNAQACERACI